MNDDRIAIIGMGCRFPGARTVEEFWNNLCSGVDSVKVLSNEDLQAAGVDEHLLQDDRYVKASGYLEGVENFDAAFFGYSPAEAQTIDPQQRIFLEVAWTALENAGYAPRSFKSPVGVFAGSAPNKYFLYHLFGRKISVLEDHNWEIDDFPVGTNPDALSARVSYKLGLTGPSITVQTACSTSLVAVTLACESLLNFRCNLALAGGVAIQLPCQSGYLYQVGGMLSKSGCCRPFDVKADGSVFGSGAGVVILKRLQDAIDSEDNIYAVIRGWAVRNDGANRAGYTAPGVEGQANVVVEAQTSAGVGPEEISYLETHGSATPVGDPIEIAGLTRAFNRGSADLRATCAIGSVKSNLGHLDAAAGIAGLIKTALALKHQILPKSLHFEEENPAINFVKTPFFMQKVTAPWTNSKPLYAGVSSFGLGGTNAHVILEEPPTKSESQISDKSPFSVLPISGMTSKARDTLTKNILLELKSPQNSNFIEDTAYTLALGRTPFTHRSAIVISADGTQRKILKGQAEESRRGVVFLFPGLGDQFQGSFRALYDQEGVFKNEMQRTANAFAKHLGVDLIECLYPFEKSTISDSDSLPNAETINLRSMLRRGKIPDNVMQHTTLAQPACFAIEYALARQLISWGIIPSALLGHSIGEYVAACLSEVLSFEDAVALVALRASAIDSLPSGDMLAIPLSPHELTPLLNEVSVAAFNGPKLSVVSGTKEAIENLHQKLDCQGVVTQRIRATHPFHSELLRPAARDLIARARSIHTCSPKIPYISNVTGTWITAEQVSSPEYWGDHLCKTVQFDAGIRTICSVASLGLCVEVGPGQTLTAYTREIAQKHRPNLQTVYTGTSYFESTSSSAVLMEALAKIWVSGGPIDWETFYRGKQRRRVILPTYPFNSKRHWIERTVNKEIQPVTCEIDIYCSNQSEEYQIEETSSLIENSPSGEPRPDVGVPYVAPSNEIERKLVELWKSLFGYRKIGVYDDFVALGGHSLLALQFANKLWRVHRVEVAIGTLLSHSTIAKLATHLEQAFVRTENTSNSPFESPDTNDEGVIIVIIEKYLGDHFNQYLQRMVALDETLQEEEILSALPELISVLRRDFDFRLYPNEVAGYRTLQEIASYLVVELSKRPSKDETRDDSTNYLSTVAFVPREQIIFDSTSIIFILSAVRSGSTLLRVMLGGHPQLFCPPELHLLSYSTMKERASKDKAPDQNQGIERALVEALGIDSSEAARRVQEMIFEDLHTAEVVSLLAKSIAPRLLIDKSPGNSNCIDTLRRIKMYFPNAKFIYLCRHPYAVIDSVVKNRFVKLMDGGATDPFDFGEFVWARSNGNILDFVETLESSKFVQIKYENLVVNPATTARTLCSFLDIPFTEALLTPYAGRRMRDGLGDPNFLDHDGIDANLGEAWKNVKLPRPLGRSCRSLATVLSYELP